MPIVMLFIIIFHVLVIVGCSKNEVHSFRFPHSASQRSWTSLRSIVEPPVSPKALPHHYQLENMESNLRHKILSTDDTFNTTIFCNVELNCANLEAIGFDMDFTLAQYNEAFDLLAFEGAKRKLIQNFGYPEEIMSFEYQSDRFRRGLIIDKKRGNVIKIDRHKYVRTVYHGLRELSSDEKKNIYSKQFSSFKESTYANIDTIFLLVDAVLFTYLVDFQDRNPHLMSKTYEQLYKDVRQSVDLCHRDGVIKEIVMKNPEKYILYDKGIVPMLQQWKDSGKKVFLLTNSMWEYTNAVMDYIVHGGGENSDLAWESLFDVVIVGACKPAFLKENHLSIFKVDRHGNLRNLEDKENLDQSFVQESHKVFQGGYWHDLHKMLGVSFGDRILYVGDHMYADILRSKRTLGWRTCLIIPELERELAVAKQEQLLAHEMLRLRQLQYDLDDYIDILRLQLKQDPSVVDQLSEAEGKALYVKQKVRTITTEYNGRFNKYWGQLFKAGHQDSRFAKQVMDYACLYTSRASNLGLVSPIRPFRPVQDFMPHDQVLYDLDFVTDVSKYPSNPTSFEVTESLIQHHEGNLESHHESNDDSK